MTIPFPSAAAPLVAFLHPPHCHRVPVSLYFPYQWSALWPLLSLQTYLLFHTPSTHRLLAQHARPLRLLLFVLQTLICCRVAFGYRFRRPPGSEPPSWRIVGEKDFDFVNGIIAAYCWAKSLEFAILRSRPTLDRGARWDDKGKHHERREDVQPRHREQQSNGAAKAKASTDKSLSKRSTSADPPGEHQGAASDEAIQANFPNTPVRLWVDLVFNLRGLGWRWGIPSPASGPGPVPTALSHPQSMAFLRSRLWTCVFFATFVHFAHGVITSPLYWSAFDHPIGSLASQSYASSRIGTALVQGIFTLLLGSMVVAPIQGVFSLLSLLSVLLSPKTQRWWEPLPFNAPFRSTSLNELWADRWHALFRRAWYICGYRPAAIVARATGLGKKGTKLAAVIATFTVSGLFHEIGLHVTRGRTQGTTSATLLSVSSFSSGEKEVCQPLDVYASGFGADSFRTTRFFLLQALGIIIEQVFWTPLLTRLFSPTKRKGNLRWLGWAWVVLWCALTGRGVVQTWVWHGFLDDVSIPSPTFLSKTLATLFVTTVVKLGEGVSRW